MPSRGGYSDGQDWNTVSFGGSSNRGGGGGQNMAQAKRDGNVSTNSRAPPPNTVTSAGFSAKRLEEETEELKHATVSTELKVAMMKARTAKGLTQKQLATALNMQVQVINEYESGKAIPNNAIIAKIERHLGCKLPRAAKK